MSLHANIAMPASQPYPLNLLLIEFELDLNYYCFENWLFSIVVSLQKCLAQFYCRHKYWSTHIKLEKCLPHYWSEKDVNGTVANKALPYFYRQFFKNEYFQESWQHLLRDRASRTLTYNDEQFHILEKIKMSETIKVIEDLLLKVTNCLKFISSFLIIFIELILVQGYLWSFYFQTLDSFKSNMHLLPPEISK